jgi:hypothetical protein
MVLVVATPTYGKQTEALDGTGERDAKASGVAAIETPLTGLDKPILPLEFQTVVVDSNARIMLHSHNHAFLGQNFLDLVNSPDELRSSIAAGVPDELDVRYMGSPSRVRVERLPGIDWAILVIAPTTLIDVPITQLVLVSLAAFALLLVVATLFLSIWLAGVGLRRRYGRANEEVRTSLNYFRPDARYTYGYGQLGIRMLVLSAAVCFATLLASTWIPTAPALLIIVASALIAWKDHPKDIEDRSRSRGGWRNSLSITYCLWCFGLVCVFVVTPGTVIFCRVFDVVSENLVRAEQAHYAEKLRYEPMSSCEPTRGDAASGGVSDAAGAGVCGRVFWSGNEISAEATTNGKAKPSLVGAYVAWPVPWLMAVLPSLECASGHETPGYRPPSQDWTAAAPPALPSQRHPNWQWERTNYVANLTLSSAVSSAVHIQTRLPRLVSAKHGLGWLAFVTVIPFLIFAGANAPALKTMRRILFLDLLRPPARPEPTGGADAQSTDPKPAVAEPPFEAWWDGRDDDEKRVLAQLAYDSYATPHPNTREVLTRLAQCGALNPSTLTIASEPLEAFIRTKKSEAELNDCQTADGDTSWSAMWPPLAAALTALLGILGFSRPELAPSGAVIPGLVAGMPALFRLLMSLVRPPSSGP